MNNEKKIIAPLSGKVIALDQVPDDVFSQKVLGDGIAIIPTDGKILSPVDGEISTVTDTLHAYGLSTEDGLELLVHVGIDSVNLKGAGFTSYVKAGDKVKAGDLIAEVDLDVLKANNIPTITPVLVCDGADELVMTAAKGDVVAGKNVVLTLSEAKQEETAPAATQEKLDEKKEKKSFINFDFLQKLGKVLMTVIAVMPAAGMMLSIGKLIQMMGADISILMTIGSTMENIGWAIITNLHILFAAAIGGSWAKERAGGAFAAIIAFILINRITGAVFGVTTDMLADSSAVVHSFFGQEMLVSNYFTNILGSPALNMGVFIGIIAGFVGGVVYNKFYNFRKLPDALAFFNGKRFVPMA
ncbi:MAG: PTS glucose transporter subunit IIA, partial [Akkermansia sp.]|nr:PTS glucose transporter subunit IIA [Akkermansia sp.]